MSPDIAAIVLLAALMHATWNAMVKGASDKALMLGLIALGHVVPGVALALILPLPDPAAFGFIIASTIIHWAYYALLNTAYRIGDLSVIYPVARGLAPVLIALGAQVWANETLPPLAWAGIVTVSVGIMLLAAGRGQVAPAGLIAAFGTALMVAAYSVVDGIGVRLSGHALAYIAWLFAAEVFVVAFVAMRFRARVMAASPRTLALGFAGGLISAAAYGLVLYAKTMAPLGLVSALRETSVIFAALMGIVLFGEGPRRKRLIAAAVVAGGIALMSAA